MDSGKNCSSTLRTSKSLQPSACIDLIYMRRRAFLPQREGAELFDFPAPAAAPAAPPHLRSKRWRSDEAFEMRRITPLFNKARELIGYRSMIRQGGGPHCERYVASFRADDFNGSLVVALQKAKAWRDAQEIELGIKRGNLRSKEKDAPWSGISLIVSKTGPVRSYWGSNRVVGSKSLRSYIGLRRSYTDAYHDLILRIAERDGIAPPAELPTPPPPRLDQFKRMTRSGLKGIPEPVRRKRRSRAAAMSDQP